MKRKFMMIAVLAMSALAMVSCKKDKINENEKAVDGEKVTFHATIAETVCTAEGEKTHINGNGDLFVFDVDDLFGVYSTEMGKCTDGGFKCHINRVDESNGGFDFDLCGVAWPYESDPSIAAYPYRWKTSGSFIAWFNTDSDGNVTVQYGFPPTQYYMEGNVASDTYPMIGWYNGNNNFTFYPFMSLLKVNIKGYAKVGSIVLEDKNHDLIGRTAPLPVDEKSIKDFGKEGFAFIGQNFNTITLNCMSQYTNYRAVELKHEGTDFYFVVPACTLKHFTLKVMDEMGNTLLTQLGAIKDGAKSRTIHTLEIPEMIFDFDGLCLTSNSSGSTVQVTGYQNLQNVNLQMCKESNGQMSKWGNVSEQEISLGEGEKLYFKNNSSSLSTSSNHAQFVITGDVTASGNIMSLLNNTSLKDYCFNHLFAGCTGLTSIDGLSLPSTTLKRGCYESMFEGCTALESVPEGLLGHAETLSPSCYKSMFKGCTSLSSANLNLTKITCVYCYESMFDGCSHLTECNGIIEINADAMRCCMNMFNGCSALTTAPTMMINEAPSYGFQSMFNGCTALKNVDVDITATKAGKCSYYSMFNGCARLQSGPTLLPATELSEMCYFRMFSSCKSLGTPIEIEAENVSAVRCCESMFTFCNKLPSVTVHFTDWPTNGTSSWFNQVTSNNGTFYCPAGLPGERGTSRIPEYWNVVNN